MDQQSPRDPRAEYRERMMTNLVLLLILAGIVGIGYWLSSALIDARRADDCISSGRRNCAMIDVTPR